MAWYKTRKRPAEPVFNEIRSDRAMWTLLSQWWEQGWGQRWRVAGSWALIGPSHIHTLQVKWGQLQNVAPLGQLDQAGLFSVLSMNLDSHWWQTRVCVCVCVTDLNTDRFHLCVLEEELKWQCFSTNVNKCLAVKCDYSSFDNLVNTDISPAEKLILMCFLSLHDQ